MKYHITTREEYDYCRSRNIEPMRDKHFSMDISLRKQLQKEMFGRNDDAGNEKFYRYAWEIDKAHICRECAKPLHYYSSAYISHILSRGANADMSHDLRNYNILCFECHQRWENGDRKNMRIYRGNQRVIETLKKEYNMK